MSMRLGTIMQKGDRYSVWVGGRSIIPYFNTEDQADFVCANRLGKLKKELKKIRIPFVKVWVAW